MGKNKDYDMQTANKTVNNTHLEFLTDFLKGICIGVAFIIPGFSGGTVAVMVGIYEKIIGAVADFHKAAKKSILTLFPVILGLITGAAVLLFPLGYLLDKFPLPTVSVFVGLSLGGIPMLFEKVRGKIYAHNVLAFAIPFAIATAMSFIPIGADVNLFDVSFGGCLLLFLVGALGAFALVIPGISGSMILLILGYYNPIVSLITDHFFAFKNLPECIAVLGSCGLGIVSGFVIISLIMKQLLRRYQRGTYIAIIAFIIGSVPTVYVSTMKSAGMITPMLEPVSVSASPVHYFICLFLIILGLCASYYLSKAVSDKEKSEKNLQTT